MSFKPANAGKPGNRIPEASAPELDWEKHSALSRPVGFAAQPKDFDWLEKNIPCQAACPAATDIPGYLGAIAAGDYEEAYLINLRDNVFPAVLGRVCTRPCEPACRHGWEGLGEPVAICFSKRSAADFLDRTEPVKLEPLFKPTGKKVAVIGSGPAGLAAARELARWGHHAVVYERHHRPGGLMVFGIPPFRLPRDILDREIEQVRLTGVEILCDTEIGKDIPLQQLLSDSDAVIMAAGALRPHVPDLPGTDLRGVRHGLDFLMEANETAANQRGEHVVVVGGGFTAVDCARTAHRRGAKSVKVFYRRSEKEMYITPSEIEEMKNEGILFEALVGPTAFVGEGGDLKAVRFIRNQLGKPDTSGRRRPEALVGTEFEVPADLVLMATGQIQDTSWIDDALRPALVNERGVLRGGAAHQTAAEKLFVAGDFASGADSLIDAIGDAKACARRVDAYLVGEERLVDMVRIEEAVKTGRTREMDTIPRQIMPTLDLTKRDATAEVETGYVRETAPTEASRCYLCHYKFEIDNDLCIYCDRCLNVKPVENCIVQVRSLTYDDADRITGYKRSTGSRDYNLLYIDQNECIRCGACVDVCPVECITLQKVSRCTVEAEVLNRALAGD